VGATAGFLARDLLTEFASLWLPAAALGGLFWRTRLKPVMIAAVVALAALWLSVAFTPLATHLARGLTRRDAVGPADAVLVLSSRLQKDGELTPPAMSRLVHGLELLGQGLAPRIVLSELAPPAPSYAAAARTLMAHLGSPHELESLGPVHRTRDEAMQVADLCRRQGWHRLLVVTSPSHSRRACAAVEREGVEVICSPAAETEFDVENLNRPPERLRSFRASLHEWLGLWLYRRRGWA
jgi:uncharacterized SAM-binding protein YcdF (DUF218 family)